ncbi:MAG TPA: B12-binding domain-containing radical SAM protein [Acidobacteriota bacterium]|nr:B12-binding domain-containing radical SAM protein [Acidobacteriota bacterium]
MKILLVSPRVPDTFWSFRHALRFVSKKAGEPPLGLLTVAAMLPAGWQKTVVDLNVRELKDSEIAGADYVFLSAMSVQEASARTVLERCGRLGTKVVAGGPLFTARYDEFEGVDHFVLNEAEITLPLFLEDLANSRAQHLYTTTQWADVTRTPTPLWELIDFRHYASMNMQYSRGCPFDCEFCDITVLYGRAPRTKTIEQIIEEMDRLRLLGWRGHVFFVDDNFIGNKSKLKEQILPGLIEWMDRYHHPFTFSTEASINLSDDEELMHLMGQAGFESVFVGIESPNESSLHECRKIPNKNRNLLGSVHAIQRSGIQVFGGFILGFDNDPPSIFNTLIAFIRDSGIVTAMVGILNAPRGTRLHQRLVQEGRLLSSSTGDNTDFSLNFIPRMKAETLLAGYQKVVETIYSPKEYYARVLQFLRTYRPLQKRAVRIRAGHLVALSKSIVFLGVVGKERFCYWKLFFWSLFRRPALFPMAITYAIYGFHFRKIFERMP